MTTKILALLAAISIVGQKAQAGQSLIGSVKYPVPGASSITDELSFVNNLIGMENGAAAPSGVLSYQTIGSLHPGIPYATTVGSQTYAASLLSFTLPMGSGFTYVLADFKYSDTKDTDLVYYTTDGSFNIPSSMTGVGTLDHYSAFKQVPSENSLLVASVPDGGTTIGLLALGLSGIVVLKRKSNA